MNDAVKSFMKKGYLVSPEIINEINSEDETLILATLNSLKEKPLVINENLLNLIRENKNLIQINWNEFDKSRVLFEKNKDKSLYYSFLAILNPGEAQNLPEIPKENELDIQEPLDTNNGNVIILKNYSDSLKKHDVQEFIGYFKLRYDKLKNILLSRKELQNATSINRILGKIEKEKVTIIGIVNDKRVTKNGNILLSLEDPTGIINVVISKNKYELFEIANDTLLDEVIGITGLAGDKIIFCDGIYYPDIPINNELKKSQNEEYALFTSDMQVGNKKFYEKNFLKFIEWVNGDYGNKEQKEIALKIKYLFIPGDIVDGVGVYPGQEEDLDITDIYKQYDLFAEYLIKIRKDVKIIISPGNHDAMRIAEPQPIFDKKILDKFNLMDNLYFTTNPSIVNIASTKDFSGFNVLIYHGFSFPYIAENVDSIRRSGRLENVDSIMKYLLQRRHLAPSHTSTQYLPNAEEDPLLIEKIPDFFISGHLHKTKAANYRNITLMNCSCWLGITEDQERRGIKPDPCKAILINLKTRDIKILNFMDV